MKFQGPLSGKKASSSQSTHFNDTCTSINTYPSMQVVRKLDSSFEIKIGSRFMSKLLPPMSPEGSRMHIHSRPREHQLVRLSIFHFLPFFFTSNHKDTYKKEDMIRMSNWALKAFGPSLSQVYLGLHDRALILLPANIAFHGDSTRHLLWSDIFTQLLPMEIIGSGVEIQVRLQGLTVIHRCLSQFNRPW